MLILSWLLGTSLEWRGATVTIKMVVPSDQASEGALSNLEEVLLASRTGATMEVLVSNGKSFTEILQESSASADLLFLGMAVPDKNFDKYYPTLLEKTANLPTTVFVLAGEDLEFGEVIT